jgi:S1-C subfamily serine protease
METARVNSLLWIGPLMTVVLLSGGVATAGPAQAPAAPGAGWIGVVERAKAAVAVITTEKGQGSGFFVEPNGILVTNHHVIADAQEILVKLASGEVFRRAFLLVDDQSRDLAILKVEATDLPVIPLGNSNDAKLAQEVLLLGAPQGLEQTVSSGLISSIRLTDAGSRVIQTTAAASPGSSGGPLLLADGTAIGVLAFSVVQGQNLNFAIPVNYVRGMLESLKLSGDTKPLKLFDSSDPAKSKLTAEGPARRAGVLVSGYGSTDSFAMISVELLNFLSSQGVEVANRPSEFGPMKGDAIALNYLLEAMPKIGATSLLYLVVEHGWSTIHRIKLQCFDVNGKQLWQEDSTSATSWAQSEEGAAKAALARIEDKLKRHIGKPGLVLRSSAPKK